MVKAFKTLKLSKHLNKVFIIPNNLGLYFIGLWATCFLLSVGYASNLLLFMAILQFALFFWWMITAHADTKQLKVHSLYINPSHAEADATLLLNWSNADIKENLRQFSLIDQSNNIYPVKFENNYHIHFTERGLYKFSKIHIGLNTGFWLFKTWKYLPTDFSVIIYPKAIKAPFDLMQQQNIKDESHEQKKQTTQAVELDLQKDADEASRGSRINWKRFAQRGILVERYGESGFQQQQIFDLDPVVSEEQLSYLTYELLQFYQQGHSWFLKHKEEIQGPFNLSGKNKEELHQCLSLLATYSW